MSPNGVSQREYSAILTVAKMLVTFLPAGAAGWASSIIADLPGEAVIPAVIAALVAGVYRGIRNWLNYNTEVMLP